MRVHKHFKQNRPKKNLLIAGVQATIRALQDGVELERIFLQTNISNDELKRLAEDRNVPINKVPPEKLKSYNIEGHNGCIALKSKITYQQLQDVISWVVERGETPFFLLLDGITDIRNIGGIARTAWCCGVHALVIPQKGVGALNEDAISTSAGALEQISVCRVKDLESAIAELHLNGVKVFASEMKAEKNIFQSDLSEPVAIIMGSEDKGIHPGLYKHCDEVFKIPMQNDFESLNVGAATAMILYEVMRQRMGGV